MLEEELIGKGNVSFFDIKRIKGRKVREKKKGGFVLTYIYIYRTTIATRNRERERENFFRLLIKKVIAVDSQ